MKTNKYIYMLSTLLSISFWGQSQTTNTGKLTVTKGTILSTVGGFENTGTTVNEGDLYIYNHWKNNGMVDFLGTTGSIRFVGNSIQKISGNNTSYFYNILFNNSSSSKPFELHSAISVKNEVIFDYGIIDNENFGGTLTFQQNAVHTNTSNDSYVNGFVHKIGDTDFLFPVGNKNNYRAVKISAPVGVTEEIKAKYFLENSNTVYTHSLKQGVIEYIDTNEYWEVTQESGNSNIVVTLTWNESTSSPNITQAASKTAIHIVRWDNDKGYWIDEGGIVDEFNNSVTTVSQASGYGIFALALVKEDLILPGGCLTVYNAISSNGDGKNDTLKFTCIDKYTNNTVEIFNRYGVKVFETKGYDNNENSFKGFSDANLTINRGAKLPTGTYYYVLNYELDSQTIKKTGYLFITK